MVQATVTVTLAAADSCEQAGNRPEALRLRRNAASLNGDENAAAAFDRDLQALPLKTP